MSGRKSRLADPVFAKAVAEAYASGMSREDMAIQLECHTDSITAWVRDPRVQAHVSRLTLERINRIARRIDAEMEGRMAHTKSMSIKDLLAIRKEYLERQIKLTSAGVDPAQTTEELSEAMDQNPDLAAALLALVGKE